ncbi:hypothetical protein AB6A40_000900 [Gnathostoma spinigerum]|uniref:TOG domain-containing protein n=1 Tax=Gnathostoma spinigerum TaxID=75299 RepID=A0ABD6E555_9BILA
MDEWSLLDEVDVLSKLPANFNEGLDSKKWTERRDSLQSLLDLLTANPRLDPKANYGDILSRLQQILAKDANINVCALCAKCITGMATGLRNEFSSYASMYIPTIFERFKEKKPTLRDPLIECVDAIASTVSLDSIVEEATKSIDKPNPNVKLQGCNFIHRVMMNYASDTASKKFIKGVAPLCVKLCGDSDAEVRDAACSAVGSLMRLTGEKVMGAFLGQVQEDKLRMKKIEDARDKAVAEAAEIAEKRATTTAKSEDNSASCSARNGGTSISKVPPEQIAEEIDPFDLMDPVDVLAKLPADFMEGCSSKKWVERKDALQSLLDLCVANPKLDPKAAYGEHISLLKKILEKDANINVCAMAAKCLTAIASGLRKKFAPHVALVTPVIFEKFKEKKPLLRDPLIDCIDAVAASTSLEAMCDDIQVAVDKPNPNIKIQTNLFLYRAFKRLNAQTMSKKVLKSLAPLLVKHTGDPDPEVRDAAYAALGAAMKAVGEKACLVLISDIAEDKTKMSKIKEFCEKAIQEAGPDVVSAMVQSIHKSNPKGAKADEGENEDDEPLKPPAPGVGSKTNGRKTAKKKINEEEELEEESETKESPKEKTSEGKGAPIKPKDEILRNTSEKAQRLRDERNLKLLKWNFDQPTSEHVEQLRTLLGSVANTIVLGLLFNKDFKQHIKAIDVIQSLVVDSPDSVLANSDLLLKWISLRFFETNPTVLLRVLELTLSIFNLILEHSEPFSDMELASFVPYLILKTGEPKDSVRTPVRQIMQLITEIVSPAKMFPYVLDGLKTKNSRQRMECLQILEQMIDTTGLAATTVPGPSLKQIAACIGDRDNGVRSAAINTIMAAWKEEGDRVFQLIGKMPDKDQTLLDERIKRSGIVPKTKGGPERVNGNSSRSRGRPAISKGIKGRRNDRSSSRTLHDEDDPSRPGSRNGLNRDLSPNGEEGGSLNRTFDVGRELEETMNRRSEVRISRPHSEVQNTPVRRFGLNIEEIIGATEPGMSYEIADTQDDILEPIEPVVRHRAHPPTYARRTESVSSLTSLESSSGEVDKTIYAMSSMSHSTANAAINQLQYLLSDPSNSRFIAERADQVVQSLVTQFSVIRTRSLNDADSLNEVNERIRSICSFIGTMIKDTSAITRVSPNSLKMLFQEFLFLLRDPRVYRLSSQDQICRSINYLTIRVCDNADPTSCFLALCAMLKESLNDPCSNISDLSNKCIIKQSESFLRETALDLDAVFNAIHEFMKEFMPKAEQSEPIKNSIQTMEFCIQRLVAGTKCSIADHIYGVDDPDHSEAVAYMRKCVRGYKNSSNQSSLQSSAYGELPEQVPSSNVEEQVNKLVEHIIANPWGKYTRYLSDFLKQNPSGRQFIDPAIGKNERKKDFVHFWLKKMEVSDINTPDKSAEYIQIHEQLNKLHEQLASLHLKWGFGEAKNRSSNPVVADSSTRSSPRRQPSLPRNMADGAPENEPTADVTHKRHLKPSDVEPLRQRLLNMRRNMGQEVD